MPAFANVAELEKYLSTRSYITGFALSQDDVKEFNALSSVPAFATHPNVFRWAKHVAALTGLAFKVGGSAPAAAAAAPAAAAKKDDDLNLFDEDEEATEEEKAATVARRARMEQARKLKEAADAAKGKKEQKVKEAEKSLVVLEVKPWEADTDLEALWKEIIKFEKEGLTWGQTFKLEPVAYGIKKLVLTCTIIDALVLMDDVTENIEAMEDYVQSVEVASMNKI